MYRKFKMDLDPLDHRNNTPMELLLSHGMEDPEGFENLDNSKLT